MWGGGGQAHNRVIWLLVRVTGMVFAVQPLFVWNWMGGASTYDKNENMWVIHAFGTVFAVQTFYIAIDFGGQV